MRTPNVQELCKKVWEARAEGTLTADTTHLAQMLYVAVAADIAGWPELKYDPEEDRRVEWLRAVITKRRLYRREIMPFLDSPLEDLMEWQIFGRQAERQLSGKELAAGRN